MCAAREIGDVAQDPYYFLYFGDQQPASYLSMDVDQRVVRCDSFSKVLSAGMRVGYIAGAWYTRRRRRDPRQALQSWCGG